MTTDWWMRIPVIRLADAHASAPSGTYMYEFAWPSPAFGGRLGAAHGLEIPFVSLARCWHKTDGAGFRRLALPSVMTRP